MPFSSFSTDVSASATLSMDDWKRKSLFQRPQAAGSWSALWNPKTNTHTYIYIIPIPMHIDIHIDMPIDGHICINIQNL